MLKAPTSCPGSSRCTLEPSHTLFLRLATTLLYYNSALWRLVASRTTAVWPTGNLLDSLLEHHLARQVSSTPGDFSMASLHATLFALIVLTLVFSPAMVHQSALCVQHVCTEVEPNEVH